MPSETTSRRPDLLDELMDVYVNWRAEAEGLRRAYEQFTRASGGERAHAFRAYQAALDREEAASSCYAARTRRVASLLGLGSDHGAD